MDKVSFKHENLIPRAPWENGIPDMRDWVGERNTTRILNEMIGKGEGISGSGRNLVQEKLPGTYKDDSS